MSGAPNVTVAAALRAFCRGAGKDEGDLPDAAMLASVLETRRMQQRRARGKTGRKQRAQDGVDIAPEEHGDIDAIDEQMEALPRHVLQQFCERAAIFAQTALATQASLDEAELATLEVVAAFAAVLVQLASKVAADSAWVLRIAQVMHDHLLRLQGEQQAVRSAQDAIARLCEACWLSKAYRSDAQMLVTQLLPFLIVRSYESQPTDHFASKQHPVRRLFAVKDALLLLDFDDESSGLLQDILLRCYLQPNLFRSPDAVPLLAFLFDLHVPFSSDIHATIRNQIPNQRKALLKKFGAIYFKAWVTSTGESRMFIEEECIQPYVRDAVHASSIALFTAIRTVLQPFFENKRHPGVDEMLFRITSPILWRGIAAPNDSVRRQASILLFDNFPLRDPQFNNEMMDLALQKQFDCFEDLLGDPHPAVRVAAIHGVAKVLSIYWELLPAETIRCFVSKLMAELVNDISSSSVRVAVFEGVQFILDNHNSHSILKPLLPLLAPLINDRNERVRAEFATLLVRIKSIRGLHFFDVVSVNDLLDRLVQDRDCPAVRKQLVLLFLNSYFPQSVGGSSQVARCLALVKKHPEAAMVFYSNVAEHTSVGSVCKLAALLCRCSLNFLSKRASKATRHDEEDEEEDDDDDDEDEGFGIVGRVVILEIMASLLQSVQTKVLQDERYAECKSFLADHFKPETLNALLSAYGQDRPFSQEALSAIWKVIGFLGELSEGALLEPLITHLMTMNETSSRRLLDAMIDCLMKWDQLPFFVEKIETELLRWKENEFQTTSTARTNDFRLNPVVALSTTEYIVQSAALHCPLQLMEQLLQALRRCVEPLLDYSTAELIELCDANAFGILRLVEVYAKLVVTTEGVRATQQAARLLDGEGKQPSDEDAIQAMRPSAMFTPPEAVLELLAWSSRILTDLRTGGSSIIDKSGKKRARAKKRDSDGGDADESDNALMSRWRNIFSLVTMLSTECVALVLQHDSACATARGFVDGIVTELTTQATSMGKLDRAIVFHISQLLWLLQKNSHQPCASASDPTREWTTRLRRVLESVRDQFEDACLDLLAPVRPFLAQGRASAASDPALLEEPIGA